MYYRTEPPIHLRADQQRSKREKEEKNKEIELCVIGELSTLEPLMQGVRGQQQEQRLGSFLGLGETEETFLTWLEAYKLDAKQIDVTSRW